MTEFAIIRDFCRDIGPQHQSTRVDIGDDAAVFEPSPEYDIAVSTDTLVEGVHFLHDAEPADLAHKILAVNCSDMAAMGARPKYATLALTLPVHDQPWLASFSAALRAQAERYRVQLIGGDTTKGPLTLSLTIIGLICKSNVLSRSGARAGDELYVSGTLGDAALGLASLRSPIDLAEAHQDHVRAAHQRPTARVDLGLALVDCASSCIDISDGLVADLGHLCEQSRVSMTLALEQIPLSDAYQFWQRHQTKPDGQHSRCADLDLALYGGDDYELAFTVAPKHRQAVQSISRETGVAVSKIGVVTEQGDTPIIMRYHNSIFRPDKNPGYDHFS